MGFINSYKRLEKICSEIMDVDVHGVSTYIDEMLNMENGNDYVVGWQEDLKALKHYRWMRNQIAHEPDCSEENMCKQSDEMWVDDFYSRIINQTDPIAMYRKAVKQSASKPTKKTAKVDANGTKKKTNSRTYSSSAGKTYENDRGCLPYVVCLAFVATILVVILKSI